MSKNLIPLIFGFVFSGIFITIGAFFLKNNQELLDVGIEVDGVVIRNSESRDSDGTTYYPVAEFELENGEKVIQEMNFGSSPPEYAVGETIPIIYKPGDPSSASINSTFWMTTFPWIFIGAGIFAQLIMVFVFFRIRKDSNNGRISENLSYSDSKEKDQPLYEKSKDKNKDKGNPFLMD